MMSTRMVIVTPPVIKPCEAGVSGAAAASRLRALGVACEWIDGNAGWFRHTLSPDNLTACLQRAQEALVEPGLSLAFAQARDAVALAPLRNPATYADRPRYSSAVNHLVNALRLASVPWPGVRLRVADLEIQGRRAERSADLLAFAATPGPFDAYFEAVLIPWLVGRSPAIVGLSLSFFNQAWATFRLAWLLREHLPKVPRWLGGPLPACWSALGSPMDSALFQLFHRVVPTPDDVSMAALAVELGGRPGAPLGPLGPDPTDLDEGAYMAPMPILPIALGRGCYWRRCTFCPDHLHDHHQGCDLETLRAWLWAVARRFPEGAMLHLTDSALEPARLDALATIIARDGLPLRWHGFVRLERQFTDPAFVGRLAAGGATMLQFGLETASSELLRRMGKGIGPEQARDVLRTTSAAGIRNHVYLLFGLPGETEEDRETTLQFVEREQASIHDLNNALLNLPRGSPMHCHPERFGITHVSPFGRDTDLSLYDDFHCSTSHPRLEARRWLNRRFFKSQAVRRILGQLNNPFKANHSCFLP